MELKKLIESIGSVNDPRRQWGNLRHKLEDILTYAREKTLKMKSLDMNGENGYTSFWNCPMGYQTVTPSVEFLNV